MALYFFGLNDEPPPDDQVGEELVGEEQAHEMAGVIAEELGRNPDRLRVRGRRNERTGEEEHRQRRELDEIEIGQRPEPGHGRAARPGEREGDDGGRGDRQW